MGVKRVVRISSLVRLDVRPRPALFYAHLVFRLDHPICHTNDSFQSSLAERRVL